MQVVNLLPKREYLGPMGRERGPLLILQVFDGARRLSQQFALVRQRLFQRLILHFQLDIVRDNVRSVPAKGFAHLFLQEKDAQFEVEIFMLELLQLLLVLFDAPAAERRGLARRSI